MKSLNRTLSLVLVLAMCLGLMGVASAATFTDNTTIQYTEAVSVMTGIGAINGYADGTFKPTATITREEAAKMVCYAVLGPTIAAKLSVTATGFSDVAASRWSAPFIGYCVSTGIINGMGDGTFAPTANVTGYQLAKMLLAAAGYGKKGEFTGASWELNVAVAGNKGKIFTSAKTADFSKAATREEAALYVFNAITKTPTVSYSKLTEDYTNVLNFTATTGSDSHFNADTYAQIGENVYSTLTKSAATVGGATGYIWKLGATTISGFVSSVTVLATSTDGTLYAELTAANNTYYMGYQPDTDPSVTYYYNDGVVSATYPTAAAGADDAAKTAVNVQYIKDACAITGAVVKFLDTDSDGYYDKVSVTVKTVEKLAAAPTTTTSGAVTTVTIGTITKTSDLISYPAGLVRDDVILYYTSALGKVYVEKATAVTGTIASYVDDRYVTINSTKYPASGLFLTAGGAANVVINDLEALLGKAGYTFFVDDGGNVCYVAAPTGAATVSNAVFVSATDTTSSFGTNTYKAMAVKPDGTQSAMTVYKVAKAGGTPAAVVGTTLTSLAAGSGGTAGQDNGELIAGQFYTYATNADGTYNLTVAPNQTAKGTTLAAAPAIANGDTSYVVTGNKAQFLGLVTAAGGTATFSGLTPVYTASKVATAGTIFMYYDATAKTYTVKTGIANALSYAAGGTIFVLADSTDNYAQIVVCTGATSTTSVAGYDQIFVTSGATVSADANSTATYTYTAVVNGVKDKTVTSYDALTKGTLYFAKDYATNGYIKTGAALTGTVGTTHTALTNIAYAGGSMSVTGTPSASYVLGATCPIYVCDVNGSTTTVSTVTADIADAMVYAGANDTIVLIPTSASDATVAAIYIYHIV